MKKTLAILLAMAMLCMMAVGTTLTYFTDEDGDVNTMVVGKVTIKQIEQKRDTNGVFVNLTETNGVASLGNLYPYIGAAELDENGWYDTNKNAVDKIVTVKNTGSETAYIRTLFAFEAVGSADPVATDVLHVNYNSAAGTWKKLTENPIAITKTVGTEDVTTQYYVYSFTYNATLAGGATSAISLKQIALDCQQGNAFSDSVDGNYDILALSQAVQFQGFADADAAFTAAFPISEAKLIEWFGNLNP